MRPLVHYKKIHSKLVVGDSVILLPLDHPSPEVTNTKYISTSKVTRIAEDGEFWTENTHYVKLQKIWVN